MCSDVSVYIIICGSDVSVYIIICEIVFEPHRTGNCGKAGPIITSTLVINSGYDPGISVDPRHGRGEVKYLSLHLSVPTQLKLEAVLIAIVSCVLYIILVQFLIIFPAS